MRCTWCGKDPDEAARHHEGPHATWCPRYRPAPLPPGAYRKDGRVVVDNIRDVVLKATDEPTG